MYHDNHLRAPGLGGIRIFPGIMLAYHDVNEPDAVVTRPAVRDMLEIDYCRSGRAEFRVGENFYYLSQGDLSVTRRTGAGVTVDFPLGHYTGITICVDLAQAPMRFSGILDDVNVEPRLLCEKYSVDEKPFVLRSNAALSHILSELYAVPESIRMGYQKLKVFELLLFLIGMDLTPDVLERQRLNPNQAALAKDVNAYLTAHPDRRITVEQLSERFHVSGTLIKSSFKAVYGTSIYAITKQQKMHAAAEILRAGDTTVLEIAGRFGYDNASKFASAFRSVMGVTPNEYRTVSK
ncbi:MAG: helix-turn-helix transcriptional regulator [Oscillospiraceae bacterium]|nr:helix-turn-helix transcriptional regulator [Oscillospiraceae bacterium]